MGAILKRWTGSAWEAKPLKYWNGSAWVTKQLKYWNGSAWVGGAAAGPYADSFNRADAMLDASLAASGGWSWTADGTVANGCNILSNQLRCNITSTTGTAYRTPSVGSADHYVQFKTVSTSISTGPFMACRLADVSNFVGIRAGNGGAAGMIEVYKRASGTLSNLYASSSGAFVVGDVLRLECSGNNFTVKKNGVVVTGPTTINQLALNNVATGIVARSVLGVFSEDFEAGAL
jgi:hypothetical protein